MTTFKQKKCMKCGNNHDEEGVLCQFCRQDVERNLAKQKQCPAHYWVECLIPRDGDTVLQVGNIRYTFKHNKHGHSVCEMVNPGHYAQVLKSSFYRPYDIPADTESDDDNDEKNKKPPREWLDSDIAAQVDTLAAKSMKPAEIAKAINEQRPESPVTWQRIAKYLAEKAGE